MIFYHDSFVDAQKRLTGLAASPVLPADCQKRIREFLDYMDDFPNGMRGKLVELAETLPAKVPRAEDVVWEKLEYLYQEAHCEISDLTPAAEELLKSIPGHLNPDDLRNL